MKTNKFSQKLFNKIMKKLSKVKNLIWISLVVGLLLFFIGVTYTISIFSGLGGLFLGVGIVLYLLQYVLK